MIERLSLLVKTKGIQTFLYFLKNKHFQKIWTVSWETKNFTEFQRNLKKQRMNNLDLISDQILSTLFSYGKYCCVEFQRFSSI